jgi:hypothetical protein
LDGGGKPIRGSTTSYALTMHVEPTKDYPEAFAIARDPGKDGSARGTLDMSKDRDPPLLLMTTIPFSDWPAWVEKHSDSVPYYGAFGCHEV